MTPNVTLLDLIDTVCECGVTEAELLATVVYLVNTGKVRLCGAFRGCVFPLEQLDGALVASAA